MHGKGAAERAGKDVDEKKKRKRSGRRRGKRRGKKREKRGKFKF